MKPEDRKPNNFSDIKRPAIGDSLNKKTRAIKPEKAGKILNLKSPRKPVRQKDKVLGKITFVAFIVLLVVIGFVGFNAYQFRESIVDSLRAGLYDLKNITENFKPLNSGLDREGILASNQELDLNQNINNLVAKFWPVLSDSLGTYSSFKDVTLGIIALFQESAVLLNKSTDLVFNQQGEELIAEIEAIKETIDQIVDQNTNLAQGVGGVKELSGSDLDFYLPFQINLSRFQKFLDAFLPWLKSSKEHHLLLVLQNTATMRPTGGLIETYADVVINGGRVTSINIHDISEADQKLDTKIIPPKPLQIVTDVFESEDANWFFDFSESGSKILQLLEKSDLNKNITFDGIIAITPEVVSQTLEITGPIKLTSEDIEIDNKNFLTEIQKEDRGNYQLRILKELTPLIFEKMGLLDPSQKQLFFNSFSSWKKSRAIQIYFKDPSFQNFFDTFEFSGKPQPLSQDFYGDYLGLVNSNIGGGKSDIFIDQKVALNSFINEDGLVNNNLKIERTHLGQNEKYSFFNSANQTYLKIFTPKSSRLEAAEGGLAKTLTPLANYSGDEYLTDSLLSQTESTKKEYLSFSQIESFIEYNRNVFATWLKTPAGKTDIIKINYTHRLLKAPKEGAKYQFIFENQPGIKSRYVFEISAPVGFIWQESKSPVFDYEGENISGKLILDLTLVGG